MGKKNEPNSKPTYKNNNINKTQINKSNILMKKNE